MRRARHCLGWHPNPPHELLNPQQLRRHVFAAVGRLNRPMRAALLPCLVVLLLAACAAPRQQAVAPAPPCAQQGLASWYTRMPGQTRTASGEQFNPAAFTAAHRSLPFGTRVRVTDVATGRSVVVRITDRGPVAHDRIIDLSVAAAKVLDMRREGVALVRVEPLPAAAVSASPALDAAAGVCLGPQIARS